MSRPRLMMIDEMSLGLAPKIISELFQVIRQLNHDGMSILLIEQNARQALAIADRAYVLENGRVTLEGTGQELLANPQVKEAYLGL
jgi:branched-chain amino acid transport system ATP-binding protein